MLMPTVELKHANAVDPPADEPSSESSGTVLVPAPGGSNAHYSSALARGRWTHTADIGAGTSLACITKTDD